MRLCSVDGCGNPHKGNGLCQTHTTRMKRYGTTSLPPPPPPEFPPDAENEVWVPVAGHEDAYEVSSHGRVRSSSRSVLRRDGKQLRIKGRMLRPTAGNRGYLRVGLGGQVVPVHSIVARAFLGPPPERLGTGDFFTVNHINGDKTNNRAENLEYVTSRDNIRHARDLGLLDVRGVGNGRCKLTNEQVREIRLRYQRGVTRQVDLAAEYGVDQGTISRVVRGAGWTHLWDEEPASRVDGR